MPGKNSPSAKRCKAAYTNKSYATGACRAMTVGLREGLLRQLPADKLLELLRAYRDELDAMVEAKDFDPPFLDRAIEKALAKVGIESKES